METLKQIKWSLLSTVCRVARFKLSLPKICFMRNNTLCNRISCRQSFYYPKKRYLVSWATLQPMMCNKNIFLNIRFVKIPCFSAVIFLSSAPRSAPRPGGMSLYYAPSYPIVPLLHISLSSLKACIRALYETSQLSNKILPFDWLIKDLARVFHKASSTAVLIVTVFFVCLIDRLGAYF